MLCLGTNQGLQDGRRRWIHWAMAATRHQNQLTTDRIETNINFTTSRCQKQFIEYRNYTLHMSYLCSTLSYICPTHVLPIFFWYFESKLTRYCWGAAIASSVDSSASSNLYPQVQIPNTPPTLFRDFLSSTIVKEVNRKLKIKRNLA